MLFYNQQNALKMDVIMFSVECLNLNSYDKKRMKAINIRIFEGISV